jgi:hypothetical protein
MAKNWAEAGAKIDSLSEKKPLEAAKAYRALRRELEASSGASSFWAAKCVLGEMRALCLVGEIRRATELWNSSMDDGLAGIGIYALENGQVAVEDLLTYDMICAQLHTHQAKSQRERAEAVAQYMSRVCEQLLEAADKATLRLAIGNWKLHLREIFVGVLPFSAAEPLIRFERLLPEPVPLPQRTRLPALASWNPPKGLSELSVMQRRGSQPKSRRPA